MAHSEKQARVLLMIWDGLRPEFVQHDLTPNLCALAEGGVWFQNHHAVFPSETRVNSSSISTGCYPATHGVVGNSLYVPAVDARASLNTGDHEVLQALQQRPEGLLSVPALSERLEAFGLPVAVVSSGSPGSAYLQNPSVNGAMINVRGVVMPEGLEAEICKRFGAFPQMGVPATAWNDYAVRVLLEDVFPADYPVMVLWLCDPDSTQHKEGLGAPLSIQAIRENDERLGRIVEEADLRGIHLMVGSDHGFSTLEGPADLEATLEEAGFRSGELVMVSGGICAVDRSEEKVERLASCLLDQPWCGPIFTRAKVGEWEGSVSGTFSQAAVFMDHEIRAPDVAYSRVWTDDKNASGIPGITLGKSGIATHGTCSPYDMRNVLVAGGPRFKSGMVSDLPSGNVDLAPTICTLLGLTLGEEMDGRVLQEGLEGGPDPGEVHRAVYRPTVASGGRSAHLEILEVNGTRYLEKGWIDGG